MEQVGDSVFYQGDCLEVAPALGDGSADLIITDPPYGIGGDRLDRHYNRDESFVVDGYVEVPAAEYESFTHAWVQEAARLLRPGGSLYVVSGYTHLHHVLAALHGAGLTEQNHIIWKYNFGVYTKRKFVSSHYHILYWTKPGAAHTFNLESRFGVGDKDERGGSLNYQDREDVWTIGREYQPGQSKNKNQLPEALLAKMIAYSSHPGDTVLDLFMGGGSTAAAAIGMGRRAVGIEVNRGTFRHALSRLKNVEPGGLLATQSKPIVRGPSRQGAAWTPEEENAVHQRVAALRHAGATKSAAIERVGREFGRGRFAILNVLKRTGSA